MHVSTLSRYGSFREAMTPDAAAVSIGIMDNVIRSLRTSVTILKARILAEQSMETLAALAGPLGLAISLTTSSDEAKAAVLSGLRTIETSIGIADTTRRTEVLSGQVSLEKWLDAAETRAEGIEAQAEILRDYSTVNLLKATMAQAWEDFKKVVPSGKQVKWALIAGVAAAAFAAVFVLPKLIGFSPAGRAFRGYSPKKKRKGSKRKRSLSLWEPEDELD